MKTIFSFSLLNVANTLLLCAFLMLSCSDDDDKGSAAPPEVSSISPNEGPKATLVTINGTNFSTTLA
ncbi:MAG TPA: IPT/TIG domain-containing protein, partial [Chryseolinea sp.]|nr:IPT/TIG domain-containing protein [Chryseolinea sp.]